MKLLLDAHTYLWWLGDDASLSGAARAAIADPANVVAVSAATIWELEIKRALGRLDVGGADLAAEIHANGFVEVPVRAADAPRAALLPPHHADPFDRMVIAQAQSEGAVCVTRDGVFDAYDVPTLW